jgi:hypothetical protein
VQFDAIEHEERGDVTGRSSAVSPGARPGHSGQPKPRAENRGVGQRRVGENFSPAITFLMHGDELKTVKKQLAIALAQGAPIKAWARTQNVPISTVYRWANDPEVRREVDAHRRRAIDRGVSLMSKRTAWAANGIAKLAVTSKSDSVKLGAFRSIYHDMIKVTRFSAMEARVTELEEKLRERSGFEPAKRPWETSARFLRDPHKEAGSGGDAPALDGPGAMGPS